VGAIMTTDALREHRVLVVDDQRDVQDSLTGILELEGYRATSAANGKEALDILRASAGSRESYCLVLLDLMMPVMDGWQFIAEQQRDPVIEAIPVVVISSIFDLSQEGTNLPVHSYLEKPLDVRRLLTIVRQYCKTGHA
jgi:CheY-like chemotaxis protein